jgi:hypothetical protein
VKAISLSNIQDIQNLWLTFGMFDLLRCALLLALAAGLSAARPKSITVECPDPKTNCTVHVQAALDAEGVEIIRVPASVGPWQVGPLFIRKGNRTVLFAPGAELVAIEDGFHGTSDCLVTVQASANK